MIISDFSAIFTADFGLFRPYRSPADMTRHGRYGSILAESARFSMNRSRFGTNRAASTRIREKKKMQTWHQRVGHRVPHRATLDAGAAPSQPRPCFLGFNSNCFTSIFQWLKRMPSPYKVVMYTK